MVEKASSFVMAAASLCWPLLLLLFLLTAFRRTDPGLARPITLSCTWLDLPVPSTLSFASSSVYVLYVYLCLLFCSLQSHGHWRIIASVCLSLVH